LVFHKCLQNCWWLFIPLLWWTLLYQHESHCQPLCCYIVVFNVMAMSTASYPILCGTCDEYSHMLKSLMYSTKKHSAWVMTDEETDVCIIQSLTANCNRVYVNEINECRPCSHHYSWERHLLSCRTMPPTFLDSWIQSTCYLADGFGTKKCTVTAVAGHFTGVGGNYVMVENSTHADIILFIQNKSMNNPLKFDRWFMGYSGYLEIVYGVNYGDLLFIQCEGSFLLYTKPYFASVYTQMLTTLWFDHPYEYYTEWNPHSFQNSCRHQVCKLITCYNLSPTDPVWTGVGS
jgi:hypothetical protein